MNSNKLALYVLAAFLLSSGASGLTIPLRGVSVLGIPVASEGSSLQYRFDIALPAIRLSWWNRTLLAGKTGTLKLQQARISWVCPNGLPPKREDGNIVINLMTGAETATWRGAAVWNKTLITLSPEPAFAVQGKTLISVAEKRRLTVGMALEVPKPDTYKGCTPKLHTSTVLESNS